MRVIIIQNPQNAAAVERETPRPGEGEALLKIIHGGICGNDLAPYRGMSAYVSYPRTIGHKLAVEVVEVGDNVHGIKPGMTVTGNPYSNCRTCYSYHRGMVNCCVRDETMGVQREGAFSDYPMIPIGRLYDGQGTDPKGLALIEPFCISCREVSRASVKPGNKVLVFGIDAIGVLAGMMTESFGAWMYIMGIAGGKVETAVRDFHLGGGSANESRERLDAFVREVIDRDRFDVTVEAVGVPSTFLGCAQVAVSREYAVVVDVAKHSADFNLLEPQRKGLEMHGSRAATAADFVAVVKLVKDGLVDLKRLISRAYPARSTAEVFRDPDQSYGEITKVKFEF